MTFQRCDSYLGAAVDGEYPWPIEDNRCVLELGHEGAHRKAVRESVPATCPDEMKITLGQIVLDHIGQGFTLSAGATRETGPGSGWKVVVSAEKETWDPATQSRGTERAGAWAVTEDGSLAEVPEMADRASLEDFLTEVRVRAANDLTSYVCDGRLLDTDGDRPDPADVHEDVREALAAFFEEIRLRVEGPKCATVVPIGTNTGAACRLLAGHTGECEPCVGSPVS